MCILFAFALRRAYEYAKGKTDNNMETHSYSSVALLMFTNPTGCLEATVYSQETQNTATPEICSISSICLNCSLGNN